MFTDKNSILADGCWHKVPDANVPTYALVDGEFQASMTNTSPKGKVAEWQWFLMRIRSKTSHEMLSTGTCPARNKVMTTVIRAIQQHKRNDAMRSKENVA
jgi:hypothetical protein